MTTRTDLLRRLRAHTPNTGLGREFYTDERIYELDLELIFYREWLFVAHTEGYLHPGLNGATVDDVAANWAAINDETGYYVPGTLMDWAGHYMSHLRPTREGKQ